MSFRFLKVIFISKITNRYIKAGFKFLPANQYLYVCVYVLSK